MLTKPELIKTIISHIVKAQNSVLNDKQVEFITTQVNNLSNGFLRKYSNVEDKFVSMLTLSIFQELEKQKKQLPEAVHLDVHEMLKKEMTDHPETLSNNLPTSEEKLKDIFRIPQPTQLQSIINPKALETRAYIVLDRMHLAYTSDDRTKFTWYLSTQSSNTTGTNAVGVSAMLQDITKIKVHPFIFPNTRNAITSAKRLSILVDELETQAYNAAYNMKKFHVLFNISEDTDSQAPYILSTIDDTSSEFVFNRPVIQLTSLTLSFGNPLQTLSLDADRLSATITAVGNQTLLSFSQPHMMATSDIVIISNFNTTQPLEDSIQISLMNDINGWPIVDPITSTTASIDVDLSGILGTIINNPQPSVYLDSKRFIIPIEFTYKRVIQANIIDQVT
jgi:hypothetical protein